MKKLDLNLSTVAGIIIVAVIVLMLGTLVTQQFIPTFKGVQLNIGFMTIFVLIASLIAITIIKKEFSFNKSEILPLLIAVAIIGGIIYFLPAIMEGTMFQQSAIQLKPTIMSIISP